MTLSLLPIYAVDILGSTLMLIFSTLCMRQALQVRRKKRHNALTAYILWLITALFSFGLLRSLGHLVKYILIFSGNNDLWLFLAPLSGSLITVTFIVIFATTLFFRDMLVIMNKMQDDKVKIEQTSAQLLQLNRDIETMVSDRTQAELSLRFAHEIRNPVAIIAGLLRRMSCREEDKIQNRRFRDAILGQTRKLENLVKRFEDLQSQTHSRFTVIELNELIKSCLQIIECEAKTKGIAIDFTPSEQKLFCQGDRRYLQVALLHIIRNSLEACRRGERITISTGHDQDGSVLVISDNGPGISQEVLEHIFEPFYSTKQGSTGLGLPYVRQILREHRGDIRLESRPGQGCRVVIHLPSHLGELKKANQEVHGDAE